MTCNFALRNGLVELSLVNHVCNGCGYFCVALKRPRNLSPLQTLVVNENSRSNYFTAVSDRNGIRNFGLLTNVGPNDSAVVAVGIIATRFCFLKSERVLRFLFI